MRKASFILFFTTFFSLYSLMNYYIYIRILYAVPQEGNSRTIFLVVFLFLALSYICGRLLERIKVCRLSTFIIRTGSLWLAAMLYLFLIFLLTDTIIFGVSMFYTLPGTLIQKYVSPGILIGVSIVLFIGYFRARDFRTTRIAVSIDKQNNKREKLCLVFVSDIHLGSIINNSRLKKMVDAVNSLNPDIVLLGGDILDEDLAPVLARDLGDLLRSIRSQLGVYAVTGNHEFFGGVEVACRYLADHGITLLRDETLSVAGLGLVGREDRGIYEVTGVRRKSLEELLSGIDTDLPVIVLDHRPFRHISPSLEVVDLYLAGHTHHGQLWPVQWITNAIYSVSYGLKKIGRTHLYVSSGYGTWGPPVRIGNRPEIVEVVVRFGEGENK